jgi:hypothetical protein
MSSGMFFGDTPVNYNYDPEDYTNPNSPLYGTANITDLVRLALTDPAGAQQLAQQLVNVSNLTAGQVSSIKNSVQAQEQAFLMGQRSNAGAGIFDSLASTVGITTQQLYALLGIAGGVVILAMVLKSKRR